MSRLIRLWDQLGDGINEKFDGLFLHHHGVLVLLQLGLKVVSDSYELLLHLVKFLLNGQENLLLLLPEESS